MKKVMFKFESLNIPEIFLIKPKIYPDSRGFFTEIYQASEFAKQGIYFSFVQNNYSKSDHGVLRGLHYQLNPKAQGKLVKVISGKVFDVAVDIRHGSSTYGQWVSAILDENNQHMLWIPPGFAHGFLALENDTRILYQVTAEYAPDLDRNLRWDDPQLAICWPITDPILSSKDSQAPLLKEMENNFDFYMRKQ